MHTSTTKSPADRRVRGRVRVATPVRLEAPGHAPEDALTYDLSDWGALVLCNRQLHVGDVVFLDLQAPTDSEQVLCLGGEVVRVVALDHSGPWSHAIAIEFDEPLTESWGSMLLD
jgi:hypothetical protein